MLINSWSIKIFLKSLITSLAMIGTILFFAYVVFGVGDGKAITDWTHKIARFNRQMEQKLKLEEKKEREKEEKLSRAKRETEKTKEKKKKIEKPKVAKTKRNTESTYHFPTPTFQVPQPKK